MKYLAFICLGIALTACSHAGPFITNISSDRNGKLNVEKCQILFNGLTNTLSTENCMNYQI